MKPLWIMGMLALAGALPALAAPEWTRGQIVKVEPDLRRVTLKHERIKSIGMEAMTMPFKVADARLLERAKPGDKVRFTVAMQDDHLVVVAMERAR